VLAQHEHSTSPLHAVGLACSSSAARLTTPDTVKARLTPKRPRQQDEFAAFVRPDPARLQSPGRRRRCRGLALMLGLAEEIDTAIAEAVTSLRPYGYSRAEIGSRLGITRQAAQQRWGPR